MHVGTSYINQGDKQYFSSIPTNNVITGAFALTGGIVLNSQKCTKPLTPGQQMIKESIPLKIAQEETRRSI